MIQNDPETIARRGVALKTIAEGAKEMRNAGENPVDIQNFINKHRQDLAKNFPDKEKQEKALNVAAKAQGIV